MEIIKETSEETILRENRKTTAWNDNMIATVRKEMHDSVENFRIGKMVCYKRQTRK